MSYLRRALRSSTVCLLRLRLSGNDLTPTEVGTAVMECTAQHNDQDVELDIHAFEFYDDDSLVAVPEFCRPSHFRKAMHWIQQGRVFYAFGLKESQQTLVRRRMRIRCVHTSTPARQSWGVACLNLAHLHLAARNPV